MWSCSSWNAGGKPRVLHAWLHLFLLDSTENHWPESPLSTWTKVTARSLLDTWKIWGRVSRWCCGSSLPSCLWGSWHLNEDVSQSWKPKMEDLKIRTGPWAKASWPISHIMKWGYICKEVIGSPSHSWKSQKDCAPTLITGSALSHYRGKSSHCPKDWR